MIANHTHFNGGFNLPEYDKNSVIKKLMNQKKRKKKE